MPKLSKRFSALLASVEDRAYAPLEALELVKANANAKFDETIEAHVRLGIDPKYTDQQLRTTVALPNGTGQTVRIAVIARGEKVAEAKAAGADLAGDDDLVDLIAGGAMDWDNDGILDSCEFRIGDLNLNGVIDSQDVSILLGWWGVPNPLFGDLDFDGIVGPRDLGILLGRWGVVVY